MSEKVCLPLRAEVLQGNLDNLDRFEKKGRLAPSFQAEIERNRYAYAKEFCEVVWTHWESKQENPHLTLQEWKRVRENDKRLADKYKAACEGTTPLGFPL